MKNPNVIQLYLPGSVYYLHPCINNYEKYEETKRSFNKVDNSRFYFILVERITFNGSYKDAS